jgi:hypothetical protein
MEYNWKDLKIGVYKDGHERKDGVNYRVSTFLPWIKARDLYGYMDRASAPSQYVA